jgi:hypothetical protein
MVRPAARDTDPNLDFGISSSEKVLRAAAENAAAEIRVSKRSRHMRGREKRRR